MITFESRLLHYYIMESENIKISKSGILFDDAWPQTPLVSNHNPHGLLNPLTRDLYVMDSTCNHVFINFEVSSVFLKLYFADHDCSASYHLMLCPVAIIMMMSQ